VPKKIMFMSASLRESMVGHVSLAKGFGYNVPEEAGKVDWAGLKSRRDAFVKRLNGTYETGWSKLGIETIMGLASFVDNNTVKVSLVAGGERILTAPKVVVSCGGEPAYPDIVGKELAITSDGFFDLEEQPKKAAVIGAGYIAVEMAGIFHGLGTEVDLFFRGETVMRRGFDPFIVETLMAEMNAHGPNMKGNSLPAKLEKAEDGTLSYTTTDAKTGEETTNTGYDCVMMAIGRRPVTDLLGLDNAGVEMTPDGLIKVDQYENTNVEGVYAIGDATITGYELTPVAIAAGRRLGDRLFGNEPRARIAYEQIATVVFSHPPIGTIGLTEPQAKEEFGEENVKVKQARFSSMLYAFNEESSKVKTALKLVLKLPEEKVVGLHCIGPASDEMMQGFAVAVRMGATRADFEASVAIHPTIGEEFVTFGGWGQTTGSDGVAKPQLPPYIENPVPKL
jgi:glutathione reductase (NADPH)